MVVQLLCNHSHSVVAVVESASNSRMEKKWSEMGYATEGSNGGVERTAWEALWNMEEMV